MKYSQLIGMSAALILLSCCFLPWVIINSQQLTVTGWNATGTSFGKPGLTNIILSTIMLLFFALPAVWAKRTNVFIGALNLAWAVRNYLLVSACMMGECPVKQPALYILVCMAAILQAMALLPKLEVSSKN